MKTTSSELVKSIENFFLDYVSFTDDGHAFALALWSIATYAYEVFDAFAYLVITSATKRSGKTRLAELIGFVSHAPQNFAAMTASTIFRCIDQFSPTIIFDEAETLSSEAASTMRAVLNVGYRKGQSIPRVAANGDIRHFPTYCPKIFILIGDVYDTLRDRAIIVTLKRAEPKARFDYNEANNRGSSMSLQTQDVIAQKGFVEKLTVEYTNLQANWLSDRDEEIWRPILAMCKMLCPERYTELERIAADLATEKTAPARHYAEFADVEDEHLRDEYGKRLLTDVARTFATIKRQSLSSQQILDALYALPTSPWRKFRGDGLTLQTMAEMLSPFGINTQSVRVEPDAATAQNWKHIRKGKQDGKTKVARGYNLKAIAKAVSLYLPEKRTPA